MSMGTLMMISNDTMTPNKSPEPMRVIAVSSASRLDDFWSRMAQLSTLGHIEYHHED